MLNGIYPGLHIFQTKNNIVHSSLIFSAPPLNDVLFRPSLFLRLNFVLLTKCVYYCIMCAEERSGPARQSVQTLLSCHQSPLTVLTTVLCCVWYLGPDSSHLRGTSEGWGLDIYCEWRNSTCGGGVCVPKYLYSLLHQTLPIAFPCYNQ